MISLKDYEEFGETFKCISIDLSENKYENRVLNILQTRNPLTGSFDFDIKAKWTNDKYHPDMCMSESDIIGLRDMLNVLVDQIESRKRP